MCDCSRMQEEERDKKIMEFFKAIFETYDKNKDGTITVDELGVVLGKLGRPNDSASIESLIRRFDRDGSGRIEWANGEFLLVVALMDVTDVASIDDFVFSTGFRVFDQDQDGLITPMEIEVVVRLFLPMSVQQTDTFVSELVAKMSSTENGGKIDFAQFQKMVKEAGASIPAQH